MNENHIPAQRPELEDGERIAQADIVASLGTDLRSGLTSASAAEFLLDDRPDLGGGHQEAGRERLGEFLLRMVEKKGDEFGGEAEGAGEG
jgi:hypothetical protein